MAHRSTYAAVPGWQQKDYWSGRVAEKSRHHKSANTWGLHDRFQSDPQVPMQTTSILDLFEESRRPRSMTTLPVIPYTARPGDVEETLKTPTDHESPFSETCKQPSKHPPAIGKAIAARGVTIPEPTMSKGIVTGSLEKEPRQQDFVHPVAEPEKLRRSTPVECEAQVHSSASFECDLRGGSKQQDGSIVTAEPQNSALENSQFELADQKSSVLTNLPSCSVAVLMPESSAEDLDHEEFTVQPEIPEDPTCVANRSTTNNAGFLIRLDTDTIPELALEDAKKPFSEFPRNTRRTTSDIRILNNDLQKSAAISSSEPAPSLTDPPIANCSEISHPSDLDTRPAIVIDGESSPLTKTPPPTDLEPVQLQSNALPVRSESSILDDAFFIETRTERPSTLQQDDVERRTHIEPEQPSQEIPHCMAKPQRVVFQLESSEVDDEEFPPPRQEDSNSSSNYQGNDSATLAKIAREKHPAFNIEWQYITRIRMEALSLRSSVLERRRVLRVKEDFKLVVEDKLFQRVKMQELKLLPLESINGHNEKTILELLKEYQDARDDYGPVFEECNELEDQLSRREYDLHRFEEQFYLRWNVVPQPSFQEQEMPAFDVPSSDIQDNSDDEDDNTLHPLTRHFLSRFGDLDILRERLDELIGEKDDLEEKRESWKRFGLDLATEEEEWLNNSQMVQVHLTKEIGELEAEVEQLKQQCLTMNLVDDDGEPTENQHPEERDAFFKDPEMISGSQVSEYSKFPRLLPPPRINPAPHVLSTDTKEIEKPFNTSSRINTWLLDRLQTSALEVSFLARIYEGRGYKISDRWEFAVLDFWFRDGTTSRNEYRVYTSSMTTQAPPKSQQSENSGHCFRILITSSSLRMPADRHSDTPRIGDAARSSPASLRGRIS